MELGAALRELSRQGAQRVAVIALVPRDEVPALRLALLVEELARQLQRRLIGLGAARDEIDMAEPFRRALDQMIGKRLRRLVGEEAGMRVG